MSDDLITSLRALAAARHDDLSIAVDAVIEIERLRAENERLYTEDTKTRHALKGWAFVCPDGGADPTHERVAAVVAEVERLREVLEIVRIDGPDAQGLVWASFTRQGGVRVNFVTGHKERMVSQALLEFEQIRRKALEAKS